MAMLDDEAIKKRRQKQKAYREANKDKIAAIRKRCKEKRKAKEQQEDQEFRSHNIIQFPKEEKPRKIYTRQELMEEYRKKSKQNSRVLPYAKMPEKYNKDLKNE